MALLREVVHESAIVPGHYDETWPSGGSAFAHLTEDDSSPGNEYLWTDKLFQVGLDPPSDGQGVIAYPDGHMWLGAATGTDPTNSALEVFVLGDANDRFALGFDGSLHFGDGTAAPDLTLERTADVNFFLGGGYLVNDVGVYASPDGDTFATTSAGLDPAGAVYLTSDGVSDAAAPGDKSVVLYPKKVGAKNAVFARFPTGAVQQIAIEP